MKALLQRVSRASVTVDGKVTGAIGPGLVILLGVARDDDAQAVRWVANKCANLRIFEDADGRFDRSLLEVGGEALVVSQFTLHGDCRKGRRPSFTAAADPEPANDLYEAFVSALSDLGVTVATGVFRAHMDVEIHNDGPVTLMVESPPK